MTFALGLLLLAAAPAADPVASALERPILGTGRTQAEVQDFVGSRLPALTPPAHAVEWTERAAKYRADALDRVVFRGEAARWRDLPTKAEWLGDIEGGPGYRIRKLRFEVVPGFRIPALLYEPTDLRGPAPVVLNVNGHDAKGKSADYKQIRCINQAKRGMIALNLEWIGMGQLGGDANDHGLINAADLCGTSGIALHYLAMTRGLDILLEQPHADPSRVGVTGLSGGGWQTIFVSGLDERVTLTDPVAGYSGFRTRLEYLSDLGDSEQTPCDLATVVDYTHLTAMRAPRPTLLTFNAKDNCCFAAPHALPPLLDAARPIFALYGVPGNLRSHVNQDPGTHNYLKDNREALYQMMSDQWSTTSHVINPKEIPSDDEVKSDEALKVELPADNLTLKALAQRLAADLPLHPSADDARPRLRSIVRPIAGDTRAESVEEASEGDLKRTLWTVKIGSSWTVPAVELSRGEPKGTTILIGDEGRKALSDRASALLDGGRRVVAVDLYGFGEAVTPTHQYLFSLMIGTVGERPLGVDSGQLAAVARWLAERDGAAPTIEAVGPRSSVIALATAALETKAVGGLTLRRPMGSLKALLDEGRPFKESPELYCFGLLERFDLADLAAMVRPRPIRLEDADDAARAALSPR